MAMLELRISVTFGMFEFLDSDVKVEDQRVESKVVKKSLTTK